MLHIPQLKSLPLPTSNVSVQIPNISITQPTPAKPGLDISRAACTQSAVPNTLFGTAPSEGLLTPASASAAVPAAPEGITAPTELPSSEDMMSEAAADLTIHPSVSPSPSTLLPLPTSQPDEVASRPKSAIKGKPITGAVLKITTAQTAR